MRDYELTLVLTPDFTAEAQKNQLEKIKKIVSNLKGEVKNTKEWGRRQLAYPIKKKKMGYYFFWEIKLPEEELIEFNNKLKLEEGLLRYLLVRKEGKDNPSALKKSKGGKNGPKITQ